MLLAMTAGTANSLMRIREKLGEEKMDLQLTLTYLLLFAGVLYVTIMFLYRRVTAGEQFDAQKYATTFGYVALVAIGAYVVTGALPDFNDVYLQLQAGIPEGAEILTLLTTVLIGIIQKLFKAKPVSTLPVVKPQVVPATGVTNPINLPDGGCTVTPSIGGKNFQLIYGLISPVTVMFDFFATQPTSDHSGYTSVDVDWDDGTVQNIPLSFGKGRVEHNFIFDGKGTKYTGKTFNPVFTFNENTGEKFILNAEGTMVEIGVEAP
jgi:hypothetical protein